jgi:hypothetical protein
VLDFRLHPLPSAALPRGHAALAFVDVGVGFVGRADVVAVGFSQDLWVLHISICVTPETISTFDPSFAYTIQRNIWILIEIKRSGINNVPIKVIKEG